MPALPQSLRRLTPGRLRDDVRLRAIGVGFGLIPPRTMHSEKDAGLLLSIASGARRVVEIGVYEGASAVALAGVLDPRADLHLIDPFGHHHDALPSGWGATEWATRRAVARAARNGPRVHWHIALSHQVAADFTEQVDLVFVDGDHSEAGCELDWQSWHPLVKVGGCVVFHDARAGQPDGRGLPGPTAVIDSHFRGGESTPGWEIVEEADRTVAVRRLA